MKTTKEKINLILSLVRQGDFGTPEKQRLGSSGREVFWRAFKGWVKATEYRGTITYPYARAGELYRKEQGR